MEASELIVSTINSALCPAASMALRTAAISEVQPVEVSLWTTQTALISRALSWRSLLAPESAPVAARSFLTTQPLLDHSSLKPAEQAITELRRQAAEAGIGAEQGLRMRLTGPAALDHEEFPRPGTTAESLSQLKPSFGALADYRHEDNPTFRELINQKLTFWQL